MLDLTETVLLRDGDGLALDDGTWIAVRAAGEDLVEVRGVRPADLLRFAWHLGNRHLPADVTADRILIRDDHVIVHMLEHLGAHVRRVRAAFNPEHGAYSGVHEHHHHDSDGHEHL